MTAWTSSAFAPSSGGEVARWGTAGAVVVAAHALAFVFLRDIRPAEAPQPAALEQSMEVELAPLEISAADAVESEELPAEAPPTETLEAVPAPDEVAPSSSETVDAAEPQQLAAAAAEPLNAAQPDVEAPLPPQPETLTAVEPATMASPPLETAQLQTLQPEAEQPVETVPTEALSPAETVTPVPSATAEAVLPEAVEPVEQFTPTPEVTRQIPALRPVAEQPRPAVRRQPAKPEVQRDRPREQPRREQAKPVERKTVQAAPRRANPPPASASSGATRAAKAPTVNPTAWKSQVQARVSRSLRGLRGRGFSGRVTVRFTVTASGGISGASIASSSGNSAVDRAALGAVTRVSVPAPPPGAARTLTIPVTFN